MRCIYTLPVEDLFWSRRRKVHANYVVGDGSLTEEVISDGGNECRGIRKQGACNKLGLRLGHMFELFVTLSEVDGTDAIICQLDRRAMI